MCLLLLPPCVGSVLRNSHPLGSWKSWLQRDVLLCRDMGTAGLQEATDWDTHCYCFFQSGVPLLCTVSISYCLSLDDISSTEDCRSLWQPFPWHSPNWSFTQKGRVSFSEIHIPGIDDLSMAFNFLLSAASFPNIPPSSWYGRKRVWIKTNVNSNPSFATYPVTLGKLLYSLWASMSSSVKTG